MLGLPRPRRARACLPDALGGGGGKRDEGEWGGKQQMGGKKERAGTYRREFSVHYFVFGSCVLGLGLALELVLVACAIVWGMNKCK